MVVQVKSFKEGIIIYGPLLLSIIIFGGLGIYIDIGLHLGWEEANNWAISFQIMYPKQMLQGETKPFGNYIGLFCALIVWWLLGKLVLSKRLEK